MFVILLSALLFIYWDLRRRMRRTWHVLARFKDQTAVEFQEVHDMVMTMGSLQLRAPLPPMRESRIVAGMAQHVGVAIARHKPETILEVGSGLSTLLCGYALERLGRGRVIALEDVASFAEETRGMLADHGLSPFAEVVDAPLVEQQVEGESTSWYDLSRLGEIPPIDLLIVDGPQKTGDRYPALPLLFPYLSENGLVIMDDAEHPAMQEHIKRWQRAHPEMSFRVHDYRRGVLEIRKNLGERIRTSDLLHPMQAR